MVIWITGLSGAGKTSIAKAVIKKLQNSSVPTALLDGDDVRQAIADQTTGHDPTGRILNAKRICRLAKMLEAQDLTVVVGTMSLFHEIHDWNRNNFQDYFEVLLKADMETLKKRDGKGLYSRVLNGKESNMPGIDLTYEEPKTPHLILENNGNSKGFDEFADAILLQSRLIKS